MNTERECNSVMLSEAKHLADESRTRDAKQQFQSSDRCFSAARHDTSLAPTTTTLFASVLPIRVPSASHPRPQQ